MDNVPRLIVSDYRYNIEYVWLVVDEGHGGRDLK